MCLMLTQNGHGQNTTVDERNLGAGYAHLISFEAEPEIAGATVSVEDDSPNASDADIRTIKLPLYREFDLDNRDWSWFAQGSLSYLEMESTLYFDAVVQQRESMQNTWTAYGALLEAGVIYPLGAGFSFAPGLGFGVSHLENKARFSGQAIEDLLAPDFEGLLYDWDTNATVGRGNLALRYDSKHGSYRLKGSANLSYSYIDSFDESPRFAAFSDHAGTFNLKLDVRHPLPATIRERQLYILGHLGHTRFVGDNRADLGFSYFSEMGLSLGLDKFALGLLGIYGDNIDGATITFNYDY